MSTRQRETEDRGESSPRVRIKRVARRLIAERGVRDVTVREIAKAAGQGNLGIVAYYFGAKDGLIREILIDGAERIEALRRDYIRGLESDGGPLTVVDVVAAIVMPSAMFSDTDAIYGEAYNRFLLQLSLNNPTLIDETLEGRWNGGYQKCLSHLRRLMPEFTRREQGRRFVFLGSYVSGLLAAREALLADDRRAHATWGSDETLRDVVDTAAAILKAPRDGTDKSS
jgi:AcrR family transcriptional regulator